MSDIDGQIQEFNEEHSLSADQQMLQLLEEVGELAQAMNPDGEDPILRQASRAGRAAEEQNRHGGTIRSAGIRDAEAAGECADVQFVARSLCLLAGYDPEHQLNQTTRENAAKNGEKDGNKVTKA